MVSDNHSGALIGTSKAGRQTARLIDRITQR